MIKKLIMRLLIPKGYYCDGCPFHFIDKSLPYRENGYCSYLGKSDWDINEEKTTITRETKQPDGSYKKEVFHNTSWHDLGVAESLMWDGCKECGIKEQTKFRQVWAALPWVTGRCD